MLIFGQPRHEQIMQCKRHRRRIPLWGARITTAGLTPVPVTVSTSVASWVRALTVAAHTADLQTAITSFAGNRGLVMPTQICRPYLFMVRRIP